LGKFIDLTGQTFGRWVVLRRATQPIYGKPAWVCQCECSVVKTVAASSLRTGESQSCGCLHRDNSAERLRTIATKHGMHNTPEYFRWISMKLRCTCVTHQAYADYGGRGIKVCKRWLDSFEHFREDMGPQPSKHHTLERIDNDGDYKPGNVKWATRREQAQNRRNSVSLTIDGVTKPLTVWCKYDRSLEGRVRYRLNQGWSDKEALLTPSSRKKPK
jgi:hypothetical protein